MVGVHHFFPLLAVSFGVALASNVEEDWVLSLLKRQEPGTPAYECHSSCGNSITASRGPDPCSDEDFLANYAACLACAGPDDINIWRYYGATLTPAGTKCGLSTTPGTPSIATSSSVPEPATTSSAVQETSTSTSIDNTPGSTTATEASASPTVTATEASLSLTASTTSATSATSATTLPETTTEPETTALPETTGAAAPSGIAPIPPKNGSATTTSIEFTGAGNSNNIFGLGAVAAALLAIVA